MRTIRTAAALMCALALASPAALQGTTGPDQTKPPEAKPGQEKPAAAAGQKQDAMKGQSAKADAAFMQEAAMSSMAEVEHGRAATKNAQHEDVRTFARRMIDDHTKANDELKSLASRKQVTLPTQLDQKHRAMQEKLEKMNGAAFDRAYMQHMVTAHKQAVSLFEREAKSGSDADARAWAEKMLPALREHLKLATEISAKVDKGAK
jgi:putative membrane protein